MISETSLKRGIGYNEVRYNKVIVLSTKPHIRTMCLCHVEVSSLCFFIEFFLVTQLYCRGIYIHNLDNVL